MQHHTDTAPAESPAAARPGPFMRVAQAVAAQFGFDAPEPLDQPFRDSDFEPDSSFLGRPLGDH